jgi:hypothetical protein
VWLRKAVKGNGFEYYEMFFVSVDDILALSHRAKEAIAEITQCFRRLYLVANISRVQLPAGREVWATSPKTYIQNSLLVVERFLSEDGEDYALRSNIKNLFPTGYKPEIDVTDELVSAELASRYMQFIGILRWAVEIGRINIYLEVSLLSQYQANPRLGHLEAIYHIFSYSTSHLDMGRLAYDSRRPDIDERIFHPQADWKEFNGDVEEELPPNMPEPRGHSVTWVPA